MRKTTMRSLLFSACFAVMLGWPGLSVEADSLCPTVEFHDQGTPGWSNSGAWVAPDRLVLVDALENRLLNFDSRGKFRGDAPPTFRQRVEQSLGSFHPSSVVQGGASSYFLELTGGRITQVTLTGQIFNELEFIGRPFSGGGSIGSVYEWTPGLTHIVGFGDVRMSESEDWQFGYFRVPLRGDGGEVLDVLPRSSPEGLWYRLGMQFAASIGSRSYMLRIGSDLSLVEFDHYGNFEELNVLPEALRSPANLPAFETAEDYVQLMKVVERSTMPIGLYGWKGDLYILWRSPGPKWFLSRVDVNRRELVGTVQLPSTAPHLFAAPGLRHWTLVQKGPVEGFGLQDVQSMILIPSSEVKAIGQTVGPLCR